MAFTSWRYRLVLGLFCFFRDPRARAASAQTQAARKEDSCRCPHAILRFSAGANRDDFCHGGLAYWMSAIYFLRSHPKWRPDFWRNHRVAGLQSTS